MAILPSGYLGQTGISFKCFMGKNWANGDFVLSALCVQRLHKRNTLCIGKNKSISAFENSEHICALDKME